MRRRDQFAGAEDRPPRRPAQAVRETRVLALILIMSPEFETSWFDLNQRLSKLEGNSGLEAVLRELELHHLDSGFLGNTLENVRSFVFYHPEDPNRFFRLQHNPGRAERFSGTRREALVPQVQNQGCFLCRENIKWQQQGTQFGYGIETSGRSFFALTNPFPLLPGHIVIASAEHRTQEWSFRSGSGVDVCHLIDDLVRLSERMPEHVGFYNGIDGGSSIPGHLHYQFVLRPDTVDAFPLERAAALSAACGSLAFVQRYPLEAAVWKGDVGTVVNDACDWIMGWAQRNAWRIRGLTANFITTFDRPGNQIVFYFVPRDRARSRMHGIDGIAGGLEVLGEIVLSSPDDAARLDDGSIDYFKLERALASLHTPLETA